MLRSIVISPDAELSSELQKATTEVGAAAVVRVLERYPPAVELARVLRAHAPQIIFISIDSVERCSSTAGLIEQIMPGCQVVAIGRSADPDVLMTVMRAGFREFLAYPFDLNCLWQCIGRADENLKKKPVAVQTTEHVYSFLPAKPGVGATTLALNAAVAMRTVDSGVLLTDFDLNCGILRFLLKLDSGHSILEALEHASTMDEQLWPQLVVKGSGIDILHAGTSKPDIRIESMQVQSLMEYARRNYGAVCADLSGNLERYSLEVMHESKRIFLVCTPEIVVLHLAREKMQYLQSLDLGDRVSILLNRFTRRSEIDAEQVQQIVGAPVAMTFPNDYVRVGRAIRDGGAVDPSSDIGKQCAALAASLASPAAAPEKKKRFVEYFALSPARFSFETRR